MRRFAMFIACSLAALVPLSADAQQLLKQSTAYTFQLGPFVDDTNGVTPR